MNKKPCDLILLITTLVLLALGVTMVLSASAPYALNMYGDSYFFAKDQLKYAIVGVIIMIGISFIDYNFYKRFYIIGIIVSILLIAAVFIPGIGVTRNQATRWIKIGSIQFQPSEITKLAVILFYSALLSQKKWQEKAANSFPHFLMLLIIPGIIGLILLKQPHMSAAVIIVAIVFAILFSAGANLKYIIGLFSVVLVGGSALILGSPYRRARLQYWLNPWLDVKGDGWQLVQSLMAVGSGGIFGRGLGKSIQKYMYLPEQQNDFIFAIVCEELGLLGAIFVISLFVIFIWRGILIAIKCKDKFGSYMAIGITTMIGLQAAFNIAVVTGTIPVTGMSLPFFSYGGTSLLILLASTGILLNISRNCTK